MKTDRSGWKKIGESSNADFYEVAPHLLVVAPHDGSMDTAASARESVKVQLDHLRARDRRAGVIVLVDAVAEQDSGAREVYRNEPDPSRQVCFALVGGTVFGRAVASIFMSLSPPKCPTKAFATFEEARAWIEEMVRER